MPRFPITGATATHVTIHGREVLSFGGCNYLGLGNHPDVMTAAVRAISRFGLTTSASRETTGNTTAHDELEGVLARFLGMPAAIVVPDGYTANLATAQALVAEHPVAVIDERSHKSIRDAVTIAGMELVEYAHRDVASAARQIARHAHRGVAVFTDGVFTAAGGVAPVPELLAALPARGVTLVVDDCHGFCVLGPRGAGTLSHYGVSDPRIVLTTTLAKGLGCHGGVVAGTPAVVERLRTRSAVYMCTTPTSPVIISAAVEAMAVVQREPERVARLHANAERMAAGLRGLGIELIPTPAPIFAFVLDSQEQMRQLHAQMLAQGVLAPFITYPSGPAPSFFRLVVNAEHRPEHLDRLFALLNARLRLPAACV